MRLLGGPENAASDGWTKPAERISAGTGETLAECRLDALPVFDGLIAAGGRLYLSTMDGKMLCFGDSK